jgi:vancomycin permeability regulator SanA
MDLDSSTSPPSTPPRRRFRIPFAVARGLALLLGLFTLLNVIGELRNPGFDANLWWIDLRFASPAINRLVLMVTGVTLVSFAMRPQLAPCRGWFAIALLSVLIVIAAMNAWTFHRLMSHGAIHSIRPVSLSSLILVVLVWIGWGIWHRRWYSPPRWLDRISFGATIAAGALLFPLAQMFCYGSTDYRRPADVIVVFGCYVRPDGIPSMALSDRVKMSVELYHEGLAPRLLFSGGPGPASVHETEAMRTLAMSLGVPDSAIELDRDGLSTQETVRNFAKMYPVNHPRVLAVSNFYHLPRIKLCFRRAGYEVWTVPARDSNRLYYQERLMLREVAALWWYYLNPN